MVYITNSKENRIVVGSLIVDRGIIHRYSTLIPRDSRIPRLLVDTSTWLFPIDLRDGTKESKELFYAVLSRWDNYKIPKGYYNMLGHLTYCRVYSMHYFILCIEY